MGWRIGAALAALGVLFGVALGATRVGTLEAHEVRSVERVTLATARPRPDGGGVVLSEVRLERDHHVAFELCAEDPMLPPAWQDRMTVAVARPSAGELMTESPLSADVLALVRRNEQAGCLRIGAGTIGATDDYAVEARFAERPEALAEIPLVVRVLARHPLGLVDLLMVLGVWLGGVLLVLSLAGRPPATEAGEGDAEARDEWEAAQARANPFDRVPDVARALGGVVVLAGLFFAMGFVRVGAAGGTALMLVIAGLEIAVAVALARGPGLERRLERLGLRRPRRWYLFFPVALLSGGLLWFLATRATQLVPSTGVSSVQMLVSWPSGMLSFALPAVVVPIAEEVFFRGFVYGAIERHSRALAFLGAWLLFVLAHVPQTFGQWGALVAITVAGLGFTTLRAVSRSTLVSALAHLVYNGLLAMLAML